MRVLIFTSPCAFRGITSMVRRLCIATDFVTTARSWVAIFSPTLKASAVDSISTRTRVTEPLGFGVIPHTEPLHLLASDGLREVGSAQVMVEQSRSFIGLARDHVSPDLFDRPSLERIRALRWISRDCDGHGGNVLGV